MKIRKTDTANLRRKAEELLKNTPPEAVSEYTEAEKLKLIHELEVHQIELELQNEEFMQAKEQAEDISQKYTALYDYAPIAYFTLTKMGDITGLNLTGAQLLDKERAYLKNTRFAIFISIETRPVFNDFLQKALNSSDRETCEVNFKTDTGKNIYAYLTGTATEDGEKCLVTAVDITARKQTEIKLREQELQYRNLADSGLALIWTSGTDKLCNYFNEPWLKFTGRTLEQELGTGWTEGIHPDDYDRCLDIYTTAFDKREPFDMEYRLCHESGVYKWIRDLGTPNYDSKGEFTGYIGHCFDISEQKKAELIQQIQYNIARSILTTENIGCLLEIIQKELSKLIDTSNFIIALHNSEKDTLKPVMGKDKNNDLPEWPVDNSISGFVLRWGKTLYMRGDELETFIQDNKLECIDDLPACWLGVPITIQNKVEGAIVIQSYTDTDAYNSSVVALFEMIAHETGIFIERKKPSSSLRKCSTR